MATWDTWRDIVFTETPPVENRSFPSCLSLRHLKAVCAVVRQKLELDMDNIG